MSGPIRPEHIASHKADVLPEELFTVINDLIALKYDGRSATVLQRDIVAGLVERGLATDNDDANTKGLLDFEDVYRAAGWKVSYDKPGYNESYPASFRFSRPEGSAASASGRNTASPLPAPMPAPSPFAHEQGLGLMGPSASSEGSGHGGGSACDSSGGFDCPSA